MAIPFRIASRLVVGVSAATVLSGCIMTRNDVKDMEQKKLVQDQVVTLQKSAADQTAKFNEINTDLREMNGRIEVLEKQVGQLALLLKDKQGGDAQKNSELERKLSALQEEIVKLEGQVVVMAQDLQNLKTQKAPASDKSSFRAAEELFAKKEWKKAILAYQKFRDKNPKSKKFPKATFRIGLAFTELGLTDEAKTFFEEVIAKYPKSDEARKAKSRLKRLKAKN